MRPRGLGVAGSVALVLVLVAGGLVIVDRYRPSRAAPRPGRAAAPAPTGLVADTTPGVQQTADSLGTDVARATGLTVSRAAVYVSASGWLRPVIFVAATGTVTAPDERLGAAFTAAAESGGPITDVRDVDGGPQGGLARCGLTATESQPVVTCGWADTGSLGVGVFVNRPLPEAVGKLGQLRAASATVAPVAATTEGNRND